MSCAPNCPSSSGGCAWCEGSIAELDDWPGLARMIRTLWRQAVMMDRGIRRPVLRLAGQSRLY